MFIDVKRLDYIEFVGFDIDCCCGCLIDCCCGCLINCCCGCLIDCCMSLFWEGVLINWIGGIYGLTWWYCILLVPINIAGLLILLLLLLTCCCCWYKGMVLLIGSG